MESLHRIEPVLPNGKIGRTLHLVGLGDVGGTLLTGLMLTCPMLETIGIYDFDARRCARYEQEMNQILPMDGRKPHVTVLQLEELFDGCDLFVFAASAGTPPVGTGVADVRMIQYEKNLGILRPYVEMAVRKGYAGLFLQMSDPVDQLCMQVMNVGLKPEQIVGCGLGVMLARADYCARKRGNTNFLVNGRVFGPHGNGLIVANDPKDGYDDEYSRALTQAVLQANLAVRETGYKPYIAPGLSSGCLSIRSLLSGTWFHGSFFDSGGIFWGCRARLTECGVERETIRLHPLLHARIEETRKGLLQCRND
ncbi:MAG: lactate dehydrogenase [Clostridia bacterium]